MEPTKSADLISIVLNITLNETGVLTTAKPVQRPNCEIFEFINLSIITGFLCIAGFVGNSLAIATLYRDGKHNVTSFLFLVLAVFDNGVLLLAFLLRSLPSFCMKGTNADICWYRHHSWPFLMRYGYGFISVFLFGSVWLTVLVTIHRTIAVKIPHKARTYSNMKSVRIQAVCLTIFAVLFCLPRFFEITVMKREGNYYPSHTDFYKWESYQIWYKNVAVNILINCIPLFILSLLTWQLVRDIRRALAARLAMSGNHGDPNNHRVGLQLTIVLVLVVIVFLLCQIPHTIYAILRVLLPESDHKCGTAFYYFMNISDTLNVFNSSINFVLYCLAGKRFRNQFMKLFHCQTKATKSKRFVSDTVFSRSQFTALTTDPHPS